MTDKLPAGTKSSAMLSSSLLSSPPRPPSSQVKERRNPSITPRRFGRFFTPRSRVSSKPSAARKALRDLSAPALNRGLTPSSPLKPISEENDLGSQPVGPREAKRRKVQHTPDRLPRPLPLPTPLASSPLLAPSPDSRPGLRSPIQSLRAHQLVQDAVHSDDTGSDEEELDELDDGHSSKVPVPLNRRGFEGQLVHRMSGRMHGRGDQALPHPVAGKPLLSGISSSPTVLTYRRLEDRNSKLLQQADGPPHVHKP